MLNSLQIHRHHLRVGLGSVSIQLLVQHLTMLLLGTHMLGSLLTMDLALNNMARSILLVFNHLHPPLKCRLPRQLDLEFTRAV